MKAPSMFNSAVGGAAVTRLLEAAHHTDKSALLSTKLTEMFVLDIMFYPLVLQLLGSATE